MNIVAISGNLGRDPELRLTQDGKPVCEFSIAHHEIYGSGDGRKENVHWIRVVVFGKQAETVATHKGKGDQVYVTGSLAYSEWTDGDGAKHSSLKVRADRVEFGARRHSSDGDNTTGNVAAA